MLIPIPIGLFLLSMVFDLVVIGGGSPALGSASFWAILGGICGGLLAALFGLIDWTGIPPRTRAKRIGLWHAATNVIVVVLFAISWLVRLSTVAHEPDGATAGLEVVGVALMFVAGWLGGELVDRLGIGVDPDANVNASSSLLTTSARARR